MFIHLVVLLPVKYQSENTNIRMGFYIGRQDQTHL